MHWQQQPLHIVMEHSNKTPTGHKIWYCAFVNTMHLCWNVHTQRGPISGTFMNYCRFLTHCDNTFLVNRVKLQVDTSVLGSFLKCWRRWLCAASTRHLIKLTWEIILMQDCLSDHHSDLHMLCLYSTVFICCLYYFFIFVVFQLLCSLCW